MASVAPKLCPPGLVELADATALCPRMACNEHGVTHTGSQELSTAARLATGPLAGALGLCEEEEEEPEVCEEVPAALPESLLELELELELDGLRLSKELENFH